MAITVAFLCTITICTIIRYALAMDSFTGAVYEHSVIFNNNRTVVTRQEALDEMMKNLKVYEEQTYMASKQNASIIVFPEYGIYGIGWTRQTIRPYLEYIPDPDAISWNPCDKPAGFQHDEVQTFLSCMARNNSMFVVANMGARQPCHSPDPFCPADGAYQFSTNVVYNTNGDFVARYFKFNIDKEEKANFDKPRIVNLTTFDTPFGKFGTFSSSDILFKNPAVTLIQDMNITNIAYPMAWKEQLPLMSAIEFHSAFAEGMLINLLAANLHIPTLGYYGSGLYWPTGTSIDGAYVYQDSFASTGCLVVGHVAPFVPPYSEYDDTGHIFVKKRNRLPQSNESTIVTHKLKINGDEYTALILRRNEYFYNPHVCQGQVCCDGSIEGLFPKDEVFAFGAFDGYHGDDEEYYLQACVFIKCANNTPESCGSTAKKSNSDLSKMSFVANFTSGVVFPEVLSSYDGELGLVTRIWYYQQSIIIDAGIYGAPISVAMLNRVYSRDRK